MRVLSVVVLSFNLLFFNLTIAWAHEGESHGSSPVSSSSTSFGGSSENDSPLSVNFKLRSGYSYGSYFSAIPSLNSYFGDETLNLNLNYEFQMRQFSSEVESEYEDRDFNNHASARITKMISDKLSFSLNGVYETSQAVRIARLINDYNSTSVSSNLSYELENEWSLSAGYLYALRQFPNGTYLIPSSSPSGTKISNGSVPSVPEAEILAKLDSDFFQARWANASDRQRQLLQVISTLPNSAAEFTVSEIVTSSREGLIKGFSASHVNQMLASLANSGLVYKNRHGKYSLAVPLLSQFILRQTTQDLRLGR